MLTIDASIWVAADIADEEAHGDCAAFLRGAVALGSVIHQPALSMVEVTAALARRTRDPSFALRAGRAMLETPGVRIHPVDHEMALAASVMAGNAFLGGVDAVYAATAAATGSALITLDTELLGRTFPGVEVMTPTAWLATSKADPETP